MKSLLVSWVIFWTLWSSSNFFLLHSVSADDEGVHTPKPIVIQPIGKHKYTLIFLHGVTENGQLWADRFQKMHLVNWKLIFPNARLRRMPMNPSTPMTGWFDTYGLDENAREDVSGIHSASQQVLNWIEQELTSHPGLRSDHVFLGGFSQGGALTMYTSLTAPRRLAAAIALSCWLPLIHEFPDALSQANRHLRLMQIHGKFDDTVSLAWSQRSEANLTRWLGADHFSYKVFDDVPHNVTAEEMRQVRQFLVTTHLEVD